MNYHFIIDKCNRRSFYLYDIFLNNGERVSEYGQGPTYYDDYTNVYIFSPQKELNDSELKSLHDGSIIFAGKIQASKLSEQKKLTLIPLLKDELYVHYNSIITAEGALSLAMNHTDCALYDCYVLVLGYGRLGKATANMFNAHARGVSIATYDLGEYNTASAHYLSYFKDTYSENMRAYDIIINTIPCNIITKNTISYIGDNALFIDLASAPGGVEIDALKDTHFNYMPALGLPDKVAPRSAAMELKKSIIRQLQILK